MWYEKLNSDEKRIIAMLAGKLDLPEFNQYQNLHHFLKDVYSRIVESNSLIKQALKALGG